MLGRFCDILQRRLIVGVEVRVLRLALQRPLVHSVLGGLRGARRSRSRPRAWEERLQGREAEACRHLRPSEPTEDDRERRVDLQHRGGSQERTEQAGVLRLEARGRSIHMHSPADLGTCAIQAQHRVAHQKMPPARAYSLLWRTPSARLRAERSGAAENALSRQRNHLENWSPREASWRNWLSAGWAELESAESRLVEVQQERCTRSCLESCVDRLQANRAIRWFRLLMYCAYGLRDAQVFLTVAVLSLGT